MGGIQGKYFFHHKKLFSIFEKLRQEIIPDWSYIKISNQVYMIMEVKAEKNLLQINKTFR
jgi:hypothetical protein